LLTVLGLAALTQVANDGCVTGFLEESGIRVCNKLWLQTQYLRLCHSLLFEPCNARTGMSCVVRGGFEKCSNIVQREKSLAILDVILTIARRDVSKPEKLEIDVPAVTQATKMIE
jgi:hypothetical protein